VLYDNLGDYRQAVDEYEKFLRIALFLQDRCSIELVLNSIGIAYMKLEQFASTFG
jgi:tetratricopeptide (TPR) repeat protein